MSRRQFLVRTGWATAAFLAFGGIGVAGERAPASLRASFRVAAVKSISAAATPISGDSLGNLPAATQPTYDGEGNLTQSGVDLSGIGGLSDATISEAFDEPLTKEEVLAIVRPFIRS